MPIGATHCGALSALYLLAFAFPAAAQQGEPQPDEQPEPPPSLPEIIVTGSLGPKGVPVVPFDSVGSRDVYGPEEVRRTGARDLNDLLGYLPSLSTRPYNGGEAAAPASRSTACPMTA
jgi:hypothetical protein